MARSSEKVPADEALSRRERQIMSAVYRLGRATVADVVAQIPQPPSPDAIRRLCHILEEKGFLRHRADGNRNLYFPTIRPEKARRHALDHLLDTFFAGSPGKLVAALLDARRDELTREEIERLATLVDEAKRRGDRP